MNGSPIPAANLQFGAAISSLAVGLLYIIQANHWIVIPDSVIDSFGVAITLLSAHLYDWKTGDNNK